MTIIKLSEQVRRLEDTIESLRAENKRLRDNGNTPDIRDEIIDHQKRDMVKLRKEIDRCKKLNDTLINNARSDDEKYKKLEKELGARLKQVEDLQSSYKTLQEENKKLKSKLEQMTDEYDEDYKTFHRDDDKHFDDNFRKIFGEFLDDNMF